MLYQFLTTIRQADGSYLTDSQGRVTSHLIGINSRVARLLQYGIKLVFVFDGKAPDLKKTERERRRKLKEEAEAKYRIAMQEKDFVGMKKHETVDTSLRIVHLQYLQTQLHDLAVT